MGEAKQLEKGAERVRGQERQIEARKGQAEQDNQEVLRERSRSPSQSLERSCSHDQSIGTGIWRSLGVRGGRAVAVKAVNNEASGC